MERAYHKLAYFRLVNISGNKHGLLLPSSVSDQGKEKSSEIPELVRSLVPAEALHIRNSLPDEVIVQRVDERLSGARGASCFHLVVRCELSFSPPLDSLGKLHFM